MRARAELDAAGITGTGLRAAYIRCRELNARHGRTYFLATRLLAPSQRPAVHALYGFARRVDDLVDQPALGRTPEQVHRDLDQVDLELRTALSAGTSADPVLAALADTVRRFGIPTAPFDAFLRSMRMDLRTTGYPDRRALDEYVHGSAEVIGLLVLPVLGTVAERAEAEAAAAALGKAFQLTNFLRDIAEDLDRGRVYLPADELAAFGVDRELLAWCVRHARVDHRVRRAMADQIALTRAVYRRAEPGLAMLHPVSRPCVATALTLYSGILRRIEDAGYNVFGRRATVPTGTRLLVAGTALARAGWARRRHRAAGGRPRPVVAS
ncbi:phytoene/squalene synthase family protein [Amycolatopsis nigrescens]|uniref:phytoene/squalene synthase family protein n=1 Tax=Amycolatopsis nigrescens TaxID=381445 RepID=UPI000376FE2B|nr:phytoene/squalene synthase family protein [Amycolatopsis nigrescens]